MQPPVLIRPARPDDAGRLAAIAYEAWERDLLPYASGEGASRQGERRRLAEAAASYLPRTIVAEVAGEPLGWCARGRGYIPYIFVVPDAQNHGIGRLLLRRTESLLELEGYDRVHLDTFIDNVRAVHFYEHQGYRILVMKPDVVRGNPGFTGVRLEKRLRPFVGPLPDEE